MKRRKFIEGVVAIGAVWSSTPGIAAVVPSLDKVAVLLKKARQPSELRRSIYSKGVPKVGIFTEWKTRAWFPDNEVTRFDTAAWIRPIKAAGFDYFLPETKEEEGLAF